MSEDVNARPECHDCEKVSAVALANYSIASEDGIGRRTFLVQSGILAAIAALNACSSLGGSDVTGPSIPANSTINVGNYSSLANVGGVALITIGAAPVAIVRTGSTTFLALSRVCPHQGGLITLYSGDFVCTQHGATFNLNGKWIGGQPTSNMRSYTTSYDATTGVLTIS